MTIIFGRLVNDFNGRNENSPDQLQAIINYNMYVCGVTIRYST